MLQVKHKEQDINCYSHTFTKKDPTNNQGKEDCKEDGFLKCLGIRSLRNALHFKYIASF